MFPWILYMTRVLVYLNEMMEDKTHAWERGNSLETLQVVCWAASASCRIKEKELRKQRLETQDFILLERFV